MRYYMYPLEWLKLKRITSITQRGANELTILFINGEDVHPLGPC